MIVTYEGRRSPAVTITTAAGEEADQLSFKAEITIVGVAPIRDTTPEERAAGIASLSLPITVEADAPEELISACKRAASTAAYLTPGTNMGQAQMILLEFLTARSVRQALRKIDEDLT